MSLINQVLQDLEKRHASESELKSLPPFVRAVPDRPRSSSHIVAAAAMAGIALVAVAVFVYGRFGAPVNDTAQTMPRTEAVPLPAPVSAAKQSLPPPLPEPPAPSAAFNPASKLSDELSLVTPRAAPMERQANPARTARPDIAHQFPNAVAVPMPRAENPAVPEVEVIPKAAAPREPVVPSAKQVVPGAPISAQESSPAAIDKQMREVSAPERAEIAFRKGVAQLQEGRANAAELEFRDALTQDPSHAGALQALLGLLLDNGRNNEAEQLVRKALEINPRQPRHAMVLARLEVERGEVTGAINTMVGALPYVQSDPDFQAFLAALLQREGRHREAVDYYRAALRGVPGNGVWMLGLGISLRAANQSAEARDVFQSAIDSKQLSPDLQGFAERQLRELSAPKKR